jgi:glycerate 2-kinase
MVKLHGVALRKSLPMLEQKYFARQVFMDTMEAMELKANMASVIALREGSLVLGPDSFPLDPFSRILVVAVGKAAIPMAEHMHQVLANWIDNDHQIEGVVVGGGNWNAIPGWTVFDGAHPTPDANSFTSAEFLLERMHTADEKTFVLFLISGGASSMVEAPLNRNISRQDVIAFYSALLHAGLPIEKMNALRKHLSAVKGGRLALACGKATKATLLISDVPPGMLHVVGSGLSLADPSTVEDCRRILREMPNVVGRLPDAIKSFFEEMPETPKEIPDGKLPSTCLSLLSSDSLTEVASRIVAAEGYRVIVDNSCDDWDYRDAAKYLFDRIRAERQLGGPICLLSAGEVTVSISGGNGVGGRNQQWTLEMGRLLEHEDADYVVLSAGSDGVDGNSPAAGAVADTRTWARAKAMGLDPQGALTSFDTYFLFERLQDAIITGPLNNNLRDLRIIFAR